MEGDDEERDGAFDGIPKRGWQYIKKSHIGEDRNYENINIKNAFGEGEGGLEELMRERARVIGTSQISSSVTLRPMTIPRWP